MEKQDSSPHFLNRRQFLKLVGAAGIDLFLQGCQPVQPGSSTHTPTRAASPEPSVTPFPTPTLTPTSSATPPPAPTPSPPPAAPTPYPFNTVTTGRAADYDTGALRAELEKMLTSLGGLHDLVKPQARIGIKVNLTGGTWWDTPGKPPATELFATHPAVVGALGQLLRDAGAGRLLIMDGLGDPTSFDAWGYREMAAYLGAELVDLCKPDPYPSYGRFMVGDNSQVYTRFFLNQCLSELDVLITVAKMKCHSIAGVTLALKNQIGLAPISEYRQDPAHNHRSALHGSSLNSSTLDTRLPRVIVDLNLACPVHLSVIDGIYTAEGGAGPWDAGLSQVRPGLLLAGRDPVAVDAVSTAVMGFDPEAPSGSPPFSRCENYLALASQAGLGTHFLSHIPIAGPTIEEMQFPFKPA